MRLLSSADSGKIIRIFFILTPAVALLLGSFYYALAGSICQTFLAPFKLLFVYCGAAVAVLGAAFSAMAEFDSDHGTLLKKVGAMLRFYGTLMAVCAAIFYGLLETANCAKV